MKIIDPYGSELPESYTKVIKDFGLKPFKPDTLPNPNKLMRRGVVFASRGLEPVVKAMKKKKPFYVLSGIMPTSSHIHFGNRMVIENISYFQKHGAKTYVLIADLEAAAARGVDLQQAKKIALQSHIPAYIALGLNPRKTVFYFQSENMHVTRLAYESSKKVTQREFRAIYGNNEPGRVFSAFTQVGDILFPQLKEVMPGVIPVGLDQDCHIRLTRDIVKRTKSKYNFFSPAGLYHKYAPSLNGSLKMSKSKPESCIELPAPTKQVCRKIRKAFSGGRKTLAEQKKYGARVEKDMAFELLKQHLIEDDKRLDKIYQAYKNGEISSRDVKDIACKEMTKFMKALVRDMEKARKQISSLKFVK